MTRTTPKLTPGTSRNKPRPAKPAPNRPRGSKPRRSHFFGQNKGQRERQNSAFSAKHPKSPHKREPIHGKRPSGQTGLSARRAVFSAQFWKKEGFAASPVITPKKLAKGTRQGRPAAAFSKGTLPAKKANTYCLRRAKGKQKSLWPTANQRHDRRKTSEKGQHSLPAASQRETEKPLARSEPKA